MDRLLATLNINLPRTGLFASIRDRFVRAQSITHAHERLDVMPRERLADMGIAPCTEANLRSSGEAGPIPQATLW